jgi:hypothetical protein
MTATMTETSSTSTNQDESRRELASRSAAGLRVTLYWRAVGDLLTVEVHDVFADEVFELSVPRQDWRFAFQHPYAYAAQQGFDYDHMARRAA